MDFYSCDESDFFVEAEVSAPLVAPTPHDTKPQTMNPEPFRINYDNNNNDNEENTNNTKHEIPSPEPCTLDSDFIITTTLIKMIVMMIMITKRCMINEHC